jgi:predicted lipoprotein
MSANDISIISMKPRLGRRGMFIAAAVLCITAAIALDTTVVTIGSEQDTRTAGFSPDAYGAKEFPRIRKDVDSRAVDAPTLAAALAKDKTAAGKKYGTGGGIPVLPVKLTGRVGEGKSGIYDVAVDGVENVRIRVQTGPAINGTDLRDAPGDIAFGEFKNQIEYQDAGAGINRAMKSDVLEGFDNTALTGKTISVTGVFKLINPKMWLITPVEVQVQ